jgi:type VI secretion system FHA domain protein
MQPNTAGHADPLESLLRTATVVAPTRGDLGSELNTPMPLAPSVTMRVPQPAPAAPPAAVPAGAVFSWNEPPRDGRVVTLPGVRRADLDLSEPPQPPPPPVAAPPPAARAAAAPRAAGDDALLAALLDGLATPGLRLDALTPELMTLIGQLLRESTRGAVELLVARAALKREMRAEMTMIVAKENNPLKFSPSVEVALQHLLGHPAPGFMPAAPAIRDAFNDLRAHQLGVMAGMTAALDGVLQRFDPQQLEGKLTKKSAISSLLPSGRKARLWELFQELFAQLTSEAQDDFDELFGKAFLKAYETQLERLYNEPGPR